MRRAKYVVLFLLSLIATAAGAQPPAEVKVPVGRLGSVSFETGGKLFAFEVLGDIDCFREYTEAGTVRLRLIGYQQGTAWLIVAVGADKGAPLLWKTKVTVGDPLPPGPNPPGPEPADPLYLILKVAWATETAADKASKRSTLAEVWRQGAKYAATRVDKTYGALVKRIHDAGTVTVGEPLKVLPVLRRAVADYLNSVLPRDGATLLDATLGARAAAQYGAVANALEALR